jgi:hypothetical protein
MITERVLHLPGSCYPRGVEEGRHEKTSDQGTSGSTALCTGKQYLDAVLVKRPASDRACAGPAQVHGADRCSSKWVVYTSHHTGFLFFLMYDDHAMIYLPSCHMPYSMVIIHVRHIILPYSNVAAAAAVNSSILQSQVMHTCPMRMTLAQRHWTLNHNSGGGSLFLWLRPCWREQEGCLFSAVLLSISVFQFISMRKKPSHECHAHHAMVTEC